MKIAYSEQKIFTEEQLGALFQSVGWQSGLRPDKLVSAFRNSTRVISAWDGDRLVGLIRGLDDGVWQASIDCLLVHSDYQGRGIASRLLTMLKVQYQGMLYVDVVPEERRNVAFYQKHGFRLIEEGTAMQMAHWEWLERGKQRDPEEG